MLLSQHVIYCPRAIFLIFSVPEFMPDSTRSRNHTINVPSYDWKIILSAGGIGHFVCIGAMPWLLRSCLPTGCARRSHLPVMLN
ncbi:hypothetical protein XELAEV_18002541mg [Xenopus laevis]|nr:hypothetical protein XELAEV_18002541mg [Xenopus laevis]